MGNSPIVNRINALLAEKGIQKRDFYRDCGITSASYSLWNTGKTTPRKKNLDAIAAYLGTSTDYLLTGLGEKQTLSQEEACPRRPSKLKIKEWKSNKNAHLNMYIDSNLLNWIKIFAGEDKISLEDEIEKILYEESEHRIEEWAEEVAAREFAQMPAEMLYSPWPASVAPTENADQEQLQSEQQKKPTPVPEDGQDDLEEFVRKHKKNLTTGQEQKILEMMQAMIAPQKQPLSVSVQQTVDEKSPKNGHHGTP